MSNERIVPCEACGSEGRILTANGNDPDPTDHGPCPYCAAFIVKAVNSHQPMIDALTEIAKIGSGLGRGIAAEILLTVVGGLDR